jgi:urate oxidase
VAERRHGTRGIRLVTVHRSAGRDDLRDVTVDVWLTAEAEATSSHTGSPDGPAATVYALAPEHLAESIELFGRALAEQVLTDNPAAIRTEAELTETSWQRIDVGGRSHPGAFSRGPGERSTARVTATRGGSIQVRSGFGEMLAVKTTTEGLLATSITAEWDYGTEQVRYDACRESVRRVLLETFAEHKDPSLDSTLHAIGAAAVDSVPALARIELTLADLSHRGVDLSAYGVRDEHEVFAPVERPHLVVVGTASRTS